MPLHANTLLGGWNVPQSLDLDEIRHGFEVYPDDVFIVTQPKCGTTWMQELVWLINHNLDLEGAKINQFYRAPYLDMQAFRRARVIIFVCTTLIKVYLSNWIFNYNLVTNTIKYKILLGRRQHRNGQTVARVSGRNGTQ